MSQRLTDAVVQAAQRGDAEALRTVYEALAPSVLGYLAGHGVDDPEGVTADVFVAVLSRLENLTGGVVGLRKFVFTVAHARLVDSARRRQRWSRTVEYDPGADRRTTHSAEHEALQLLTTNRVLELLDELSDDQREVLTLRVVADLSIHQVAEIIGRSPGAVKQLQRRALITLRQLLAERDVTL